MIRINLLPVRVSKKREAGNQQLVLFAIILVAVAGGNWYWNHLRGEELDRRLTRIKNTRQEIANLEKTIGEVKNIQNEKADLMNRLAILAKLKASRVGPVRVLEELATITPQRLWFKKIDEDASGSMKFEGSAIDIDEISEFLKKLKESKYFTAVEMKKTVASKEGKVKTVEFSITSRVDYAPMVAIAQPLTVPAPGN